MTSLELACTVTALAMAAGARSSDPILEKEKYEQNFWHHNLKCQQTYLLKHGILPQNHVLFQPSGNGL